MGLIACPLNRVLKKGLGERRKDGEGDGGTGEGKGDGGWAERPRSKGNKERGLRNLRV